MKDPQFLGFRVESWQRETLEALALLNGRTLTDELRAAVAKHLRTSLDVHVDDHRRTRTTNAPVPDGALVTTTDPKEKSGGLEH